MGRREDLAKISLDTIDIVNRGEYKNKKNKIVSIKESVEYARINSILYNPKEGEELVKKIEPKNKYKTEFKVFNETTLCSVRRLNNEGYDDVVALNFASAKNPGGGFLKGSLAQEESIARVSALYTCLEQKSEMYNYNKNPKNRTGLYSDYMIYSPKVPIFKDDNGNILDLFYNCSFITSPAVNANIVREREPKNREKIRITMQNRIEKILAVALENKHEVIILGAFGCGVFGNRPVEVAQIFRQVLNDEKFKGKFKKVVFAVYDKTPNKEIFNVFKNSFR